MCESPTPIYILFNRQINLTRLRRERLGLRDPAIMPHQVNDVPHDMVVLYPRALQQEYGWSGGYAISKFGTTSPDIPKTWASSVQLELIERIVNYIIDHELFCLFGMNGKKFFIALESKQDAILLKLSS